MVEFDKILEEMGRLTLKQKVQLILLLIPCSIVATHMGSMVFLGHVVDKRCEFPFENELEKTCNKSWTENQTKKYSIDDDDADTTGCKRYNFSSLEQTRNCSFWWNDDDEGLNRSQNNYQIVPCTSWVYSSSSVFTKTIASDFNLVCSDDYKRKLSQSIFMVGVTFGCVFWGEMSDRYGRKTALIAAVLVGTLAGTSVAFSPSYAIFVTLKSISGFCIFAIYTTVFVLATEIVAPKNRVRIAQTTQAFFAFGFCLLALEGYFARNWRHLQILLSAPIAGFGLYYWLVFESPRWLIANKRYKEAKSIVEELLKSLGNNIDFEEVQVLRENADGNKTENAKETASLDGDAQAHGLIDLVRTPNMRSKSLKLFYCWFVCSCVYYGLTLNSSDIGGDPFINLALSGFVEIPAVFISIPILEKWGRRPTLASSLILAGFACVGMLFVSKDLEWFIISLSMLGKFGIAGAFGTVYIFAAELYPTPIRNVGIGVCSSFARVGAIISPVIAMLTDVSKALPYLVFGIMSIFGGLLALFLPEVLGIRLPETLQEGEDFGKDQIGPLQKVFVKLGCCKIGSAQISNGHFVESNKCKADSAGKNLVEEQKV